MAQIYGSAFIDEPVGRIAFVHVGSGYAVSLVKKYFGNGGQTYAADAYTVYVIDFG
jgi:hypothetical protein